MVVEQTACIRQLSTERYPPLCGHGHITEKLQGVAKGQSDFLIDRGAVGGLVTCSTLMLYLEMVTGQNMRSPEGVRILRCYGR